MRPGRVWTTLGAAPLMLAAPLTAQVVTGTTVDGTSGEPLRAVRVEVVGDSTVAAGFSDGAGRFTLMVPERPPYTLRFSALGYTDLSLDVLPSDSTTLGPFTIRLSPEVIELDGITASTEAVIRPAEWTGFARRDSIGRGKFYLKSEFQRYPAMSTFQLLRQLPLIRTTPGGGVKIGGRCSPTIIVDGSLMPIRSSAQIPHPDDIIAVEVYLHSANIPPRWRRPGTDQCGAMVIWSTLAGGGVQDRRESDGAVIVPDTGG